MAATTFELMTDNFFTWFSFLPAHFLTNNQNTINNTVTLFVMTQGQKMTSWQPLKCVVAIPFLFGVEVRCLSFQPPIKRAKAVKVHSLKNYLCPYNPL